MAKKEFGGQKSGMIFLILNQPCLTTYYFLRSLPELLCKGHYSFELLAYKLRIYLQC